MKNVSLLPYTIERCQEFWKHYVADPDMMDSIYHYDELNLDFIYADCLHRNQRSRHVLEKLGFQHIYDGDSFHYFELHK